MVHLASSGAGALPQLVFLLFAGAVWLVKTLNRSKGAQPSPVPRPESIEVPEADAPGDQAAGETEADERARRVREEILRKIAERNPSASVRELGNIVKAAYRRREPVGGVAAQAASPEQARPTALAAAPSAAQPALGAAGATPARPPGAVWLDELRSHDSARRAILVREILGPPVSLR